MKDLRSKISVVQSLAPVVLTATSTGAALSLQGYNAAVMVVETGAIVAAGNFTAKMQESDTTTSGDFTDVAAADRQGSFPAVLLADSIVRVGYVGTKAHLRHVITLNSGTSIVAAVSIIRGAPDLAPVA